MFKHVLAIETSCDDTSVSVVSHDGQVLSLISQSQDQWHEPFGGIVPEIACRNHSLVLLSLVDQALQNSNLDWKSIDGIVVTNRPGLVGSLIVGLVTAKTLAQAHNIPVLGVNHLEGHIVAPFLRDTQYQPHFDFADQDFVALAVSGGHTTLYHVNGLANYSVLGSTLDDAAGEAFDKFGKMLGLGWPGGAKIDQLAKQGNPAAYVFPRSLIKEPHLDMSFSGLKSSAQRLLAELKLEVIQQNLPDLCASFQEAIVDVLVSKLDKAVEQSGAKAAVVTGGVSANSRLRDRANQWATQKNIKLLIPPLRFCTDNAAMIGLAGVQRLNKGERHQMDLGPSPSSWVEDFRGTP